MWMLSTPMNWWPRPSSTTMLMNFVSSNSLCTPYRQGLVSFRWLVLACRCCLILSALRGLRLRLRHSRSFAVCCTGDHIARLPLSFSSLRILRNGSSRGSWDGFFLLLVLRFSLSYRQLRLPSLVLQLRNRQIALKCRLKFGHRNKK